MNNEERIHEVDLIEISIFWVKNFLLFIVTCQHFSFLCCSLMSIFNRRASEVVDSLMSNSSRLNDMHQWLDWALVVKKQTRFSFSHCRIKRFFKLIFGWHVCKDCCNKRFWHSNKIIFDESILILRQSWVKDKKPSYLKAFKKYNKIINIGISKDTGFITITSEHISPIFAKELIDLIVEEINTLFRKKDLDQSTRALRYLEEKIQNTYILEIKDVMNELVSVNLEKQMMSDINEDYVLSYIENAYIIIPQGLNIVYVIV